MVRRFQVFDGPVLLAICAVVFLPGLRTIPPIDRDEARFAHASQQMAASSALAGWVLPKIQDEPRINKPPLIYWAQASAALVCSGGRIEDDAIWMYRLPSVVFSILAVFVTWRLGVSMFGRSTGFVGALLLALCPVLVAEAHQARADHLLLALTTASMAALWPLWRDRQHGRPATGRALLLWILVGLGILAKGPVTPMVVVLAALALSIVARDARWLKRARPGLGLLVVVAIVAPWVVLVTREIGFRAYAAEVVDEVFIRSIRSREGHWGPPGYHLVLLVLLFWPGSMLTAAAVGRAWSRGIRTDDPAVAGWWRKLKHRWRTRRPGHDAQLFCLCWIVPSWIVFELMSTKLPHYTLPMYPALALLSARAVLGQAGWIPADRRRVQRVGFGLWGVVGLLLVSLPAAAIGWGFAAGWLRPGGLVVLASIAALAAIALAGASGVLAVRWRIRRGQALSAAAALLAYACLFGIALPRAEPLWITPRVMALVDEADPDGARPVATETFHEDSLIFASRGRLQRLADGDGARWLAEHPDGVLILPTSGVDALGDVVAIGRVRGFNYSNGETHDLVVVRRRR